MNAALGFRRGQIALAAIGYATVLSSCGTEETGDDFADYSMETTVPAAPEYENPSMHVAELDHDNLITDLSPFDYETRGGETYAQFNIRRSTFGGRRGTFRGYECTVDCSGHEAGYQWAEENLIDDADDCAGNSFSFEEGCIAYLEENEPYAIRNVDLSRSRLSRRPPRSGITANRIGGTTIFSDGTTASRIGNTTIFSDGTTANRIGDTTIYSDGTTASQIGDTTIYSDGTTANRIGDTTIFSDGTTCNTIGDTTICN